MKIEKFPDFLCTIDEQGILTTVAIPWENCEYVPARASEYSNQVNYPFPVKFVPRPKDKNNGGFYPNPTVAVRTDVYPIRWIYVWAYLQAEGFVHYAFCWLMFNCNRLGIAKTEPGSMPSIRDFRIDKFLVIQLLINFVFTSIFVILLKAGQPILCAFCFLLNWFLQYLVLRQRDKRAASIAAFKELERVAMARLRPMPGNDPICLGDQRYEYCKSCKYYHGDLICCAVHPSGYEGDSCADKCDA